MIVRDVLCPYKIVRTPDGERYVVVSSQEEKDGRIWYHARSVKRLRPTAIVDGPAVIRNPDTGMPINVRVLEREQLLEIAFHDEQPCRLVHEEGDSIVELLARD